MAAGQAAVHATLGSKEELSHGKGPAGERGGCVPESDFGKLRPVLQVSRSSRGQTASAVPPLLVTVLMATPPWWYPGPSVLSRTSLGGPYVTRSLLSEVTAQKSHLFP